MRILLVDDEPGVTETLVEYLEESCKVEVLNYVTEEKLSENLNRFCPQAVILDYDMVPSGVTIYKWIRLWSAKQRDPVPIVFYTKYAGSPWHRNSMLDVGARGEEIVPKVEAALDAPRLLRVLGRP